MKTKRFLVLMTLVACAAGTTFGQGMFGGGRPRSKDLGAQMAKFFGKNTAFSAKAQITMTSSSGNSMPAMEFQYDVLDGKVRTEMDMTKMRGGNLPPEAVAQMKQMGMDRTIHIFLPEKKVSYLIYPSMQAYCEMDANQMTDQKQGKDYKLQETELGKDTIDGHPCLKSKIVATDEEGHKSEALVWKATDLKGFPIQWQTTSEDGSTMTMKFTDINQSKPSSSLFEPPSDYKRYASMQELMMSNMQRMMPSGAMPPHGAGTPPRSGDE